MAAGRRCRNMLAVAMRCPNVYLMPDCYLALHPRLALCRDYVSRQQLPEVPHALRQRLSPARLRAVLGWCAQPFEPDALKANLYDNAARLLGL